MKKFLLLLMMSVFSELRADTVVQRLSPYKEYLEAGTYNGLNVSVLQKMPQSRYYTFRKAFEHFLEHQGAVVVELGTSRSFVHGGLPGCNEDDVRFWQPHNPAVWDWGAGFFTRMAAECLNHVRPTIHTVDILAAHINRCKWMTRQFGCIKYHVCSSLDFLGRLQSRSVDLLYIDTGDMTPIEPTALMQLEEARMVVERDLLSEHGILLIDDVKNTTPYQFGEMSGLGKSKYAIPYLLAHGFEIVEDEYQVIMRKKAKP